MSGTNTTKRSTTVSREELYQQVWETPMSQLAQRYGISGNDLAKICDRLKVPYPPRGWWAKKAAGKKVIQYRLQERGAETPQTALITPTPLAVPAPEIPPPCAARSATMAKVRSKNTAPEMLVRQTLHRLGYRYRIHDSGLPGSPDMVFSARKTVIFVHGCFWHRHEDCCRATFPQTRRQYWESKFKRNVERDKQNLQALESAGWSTYVIWECQLRKPDWLSGVTSMLAGKPQGRR